MRMFAAAHLDNFLFLIFFAVAILFQLLSRAASKSGRRSGGDPNRRSTQFPQTPRQTSRQQEETDEDRVRRFLEALGQPTTSTPPRPVAPRPTYQKPIVLERTEPVPPSRRAVFSPLPPLTTRPPDLPTEITPPPPGPITEAEVKPLFQASTQPVSKSEGKLDLATLLRTPSGLRNAIVLREVFGPPRSLQPLDLVGNV